MTKFVYSKHINKHSIEQVITLQLSIFSLFSLVYSSMLTNSVIRGVYRTADRGNRIPLNIAYQLHGQHNAPRVLMIIGRRGFLSLLMRQVSFLVEQGYQVCIFEHQTIVIPVMGYEQSIDMMDLVYDTVDLLDHINWKNDIHLIGTGVGGLMAQLLASHFLARFASLCLVNACTSIDKQFNSVGDHYFEVPNYLEMNIYSYFPLPWLNSPSDNDPQQTNLDLLAMQAMTLYYQEKCPTDRFVSNTSLKASISEDELNRIRYSHLPVLVCAGDEDIIITPSNSSTIAHQLNVPLVMFKGCGHALGVQRPDRLNQLLLTHFTFNQN
ncbi:Alpha/Beta hydrolase protein [Syncephalis plumigaleata]|nr:Alpha/Beta hydrolase protein [Syncephalis plumigaleata]